MKKGIHPENYRPVVFMLLKTQLNSKEKLIRWLSWKSLAHLTRSTLVSLNWWILQDVWTSS